MSKTAASVRAAFLDFFKSKGHEICASAPLIPSNDPTLMFTNAGMVPFKDVFTGKAPNPGFTRATSSQKVIRISGKHNDLENVGVTARHHTFFEMLGNFSFGDYFKDDAIAYAWELLTRVYEIPQERMVITVFGGENGLPADDEARALWKKVTGFGDDRIIGLGMKDNFWQMGETGPCGPCTEIHFRHGDGPVDPSTILDEPTPDGKGWMEIWNLVFMQFDRQPDGNGGFSLTPLPKPCVDTGAGLERVSSVLQGKTSNYETDLLRALVDKASEISGKRYHGSQGDDDVSMRVIADHARTTAFLIAEGVFPDRAGREYVLRRVMRRAIRHGHRLGIAQPFLHEVAGEVVKLMGEQYPELVQRKDLIASVSEQEEVRFRSTIDRGLKILDEEIGTVRQAGRTEIPGDVAFKLYDTFGFPYDLTETIARERDLTIDGAGYERALEEQRARSEGSRVGDAAVEDVWRKAHEDAGDVVFVGYEREELEATVRVLVKANATGHEVVGSLTAGDEGAIVTDKTPFYGESGGQVGDAGIISGDGFRFEVRDTQKPKQGLTVHLGQVLEGNIATGAPVKLEVDHDKRTATRRNHSATHLLHWALRLVLGEQSTQKGSLVGPDRLRFDFSHGRGLSPEEVLKIEDLVNAKILTAAPVQTEVLPIKEAKARGAMAIFEEKYGDVVRVLTMTPDSVELCGGTHARSLGEIGLFKIISEGGVAAGVRRLEAVTGLNALAHLRGLDLQVQRAAKAVRSGPADVVDKIEKLVERDRALEKEVADLKKKLAMGGAGGGNGGGLDERLKAAREINGGAGKAISLRFDGSDAAALRELAEQVRDKLGEAVVLVGAETGGKVALVCTVSKGLLGQFKAGDLVKASAAVVGGSGGGRPDMAQAGGTDVSKIDEALDQLYRSVGIS